MVKKKSKKIRLRKTIGYGLIELGFFFTGLFIGLGFISKELNLVGYGIGLMFIPIGGAIAAW